MIGWCKKWRKRKPIKEISFHPDCVFHNGCDDIKHYWHEPGAPLDMKGKTPTWRVVCEHGTIKSCFEREFEAELFAASMNWAYTHGVWNRPIDDGE